MSQRFEPTDTHLWNSFRQGDEQAFAYMYRKFGPILYSYGYHLCRDRDLTEDCLHDLFVYLHQHRERLGETDSIKFYLYRALRRRIAEKVETQHRHTPHERTDNRPEFEIDLPAEAGIIQEQTAEELKKKMEYLLNRLPRRQKEALYLMYYEELPYADIAQVMGLEIKSVYNLIYNALVSLRALIQDADLHFYSFLLWWLLTL